MQPTSCVDCSIGAFVYRSIRVRMSVIEGAPFFSSKASQAMGKGKGLDHRYMPPPTIACSG